MGVMCDSVALQLNKGVNMDRVLEIELRADLDLKRVERLEKVLAFSDKLGLARTDWIPATKQTRLVGGKHSQLLR